MLGVQVPPTCGSLFKIPKWADDAQGTFFGDVLGACGLGCLAVLARGFCWICYEINYASSPSPSFLA